MEIGAFRAKNELSRLLALAEKGERIYITRRGRRVAVLSAVPATEPADADVADFRRFRKRIKRGPESIRSLVEEGRR